MPIHSLENTKEYTEIIHILDLAIFHLKTEFEDITAIRTLSHISLLLQI